MNSCEPSRKSAISQEKLPPKPRSEVLRPELTRLPQLTFWRQVLRRILRCLGWILVRLLTRTRVHGMENFPKEGPALIVSNHLGDADVLVGLAFSPRPADPLAKIDLYFDYPLLGRLMEIYGVIWVRRGQPDRRALSSAIRGLNEGRLVAIAPEARESLSGSLEEGTGGAAYLAYKANVPLLPVTFTGTENSVVYGNLKHLWRSEISMTIGPAFRLREAEDAQQALREGTQTIMKILARQLPPKYRGIYQYINETEVLDDR